MSMPQYCGSSSDLVDELSSLLSSQYTDTAAAMGSPLDSIENGYGTSTANDTDTKSESGIISYATSETTCASSISAANVVSSTLSTIADEEDTNNDTTETKQHTWLIPFFINIFLACASFSIVMPSLTVYILHCNAPLDFLPWVVSAYSIGEMIGSVAIGHYYEYATKTYDRLGHGPKLSLMLCMSLGVIGSAMYSAAGWIGDDTGAKYCLLFARLIQGLWTGGQQTVEQAYLSAAVHPSKRTEYTATLSTCSVLGFVMGPAIGAGLSQVDTTILGLQVNADNSAGVFMLVATSLMFLQTLLFFDGKDDTTGLEADNQKQEKKERNNIDATTKEVLEEKTPFNFMGVSLCMIIFYVHYYSFAVQETIITPLAMILYRWDVLEINLLFLGGGMMSLATALSVRYVTRYVEDRTLLLVSIIIGFLGSVLLIDLPLDKTLPVWRFLLGFSFITIAFPIGRNVVLGIFGNVLGEVNQGKWMGFLMAISAFPRVIGPFVSLDLLTTVSWQTWLEFGIIAALFGGTLFA